MIMIPLCILSIEDESDREFMTNLYLNFNRFMYKEIRQFVDNPWDVEDVFQTCLEALIKKVVLLRTLRQPSLIYYIRVACKHCSYNYLSREKKRQPFSLDDQIDVPDPAFLENSMELRLIKEENLELLAAIWPKLKEKTRFLLEARYILGKTDAEISETLGIKPDSVRMALTRARKEAYEAMLKEGFVKS